MAAGVVEELGYIVAIVVVTVGVIVVVTADVDVARS